MDIPTTVNKTEANAQLMNARLEVEALLDHNEIDLDEAQYILHCLDVVDIYINRGDAE